MGWCNLLDTSSKYYVSGLWGSDDQVVDAGVGGLQVFQFHQCLSPTDGKTNCWAPVKAKNPKYVLWNLGEDDQDCMYKKEYTTCKDSKECVQKEFVPEMEAMIENADGIKSILVTPAPLMETKKEDRRPGYGAYDELAAANDKMKSKEASVVAVLPLWKALDCYYGKITSDALDELKTVNLDGTKDNRHTSACGAAVHTYALLDLLNKANIAGLKASLDPMVANFNKVCQSQDISKLQTCVSIDLATFV